MNKSIAISGAIFVSALILWSCSSTQQVACPDYSKNPKVNQQTAQAYKPTKYKAPIVSVKHKLNRSKAKTPATVVSVSQATTSIKPIEHRAIEAPSMPNVLSSIESTPIEYQHINSNSELDVKLTTDEVMADNMSLSDETAKYKLLAFNTPITNDQTVSENGVVAFEEVSDVELNYIAPVSNSRKEKREFRKNQRKFYKNLINAQPDGESKPVTGFAISALVLGILSLFIFPFVCGPLAIIFGGIALKRANNNPNNEGRGLALAGLITGIIGTAGGLLFLLLI